MDKKLYALAIVLIFITGNTLIAGKYYWVNGSGVWDYQSTANWAVISGGAGNKGIPGANDTVYFDKNSFAAANQKVTIFESSSASYIVPVHTIDFTGVTNGPTIEMDANSILEIYGSIFLDKSLDMQVAGTVNFKASTLGNLVNLAGKTVDWKLSFNNANGGWKLADSLTTTNTIDILSGNFNTGGYSIHCNVFGSSFPQFNPIINIASGSKVYIFGTWNFAYSGPPLTFGMNKGARLILNGIATPVTFNSGQRRLQFSNVDVRGLGVNLSSVNTFDTLSIFSGAQVNINSTDSQRFNSIISYANSVNPASLSSTSFTNNVALVDLNGGLNCLNNINLSGINFGPATAKFSGTNGVYTNSQGFSQVSTPVSSNASAQKPALCKGGATAVVAVKGSGGEPPYKYFWPSAGYSGDTLKTAVGGQVYTVSVTDQCGSQSITSVLANDGVSDVLNPTFPKDSTFCQKAITTLSMGTSSAGCSFTWTPGTGLANSTTSSTGTNITATTTYTATIKNGTCVVSKPFKITVETPKVQISGPTGGPFCEGTRITLDGTASTNGTNPIWKTEPGVDLTSPLKPNFKVSGKTGKYYSLTISSPNCSAKDSIFIGIKDSLNRIHGLVTYDNGTGTVTKGYAKLFIVGSKAGPSPVVDSVGIKANGNYSFDSLKIKSGNYIVKVFPDPTLYPRLTGMFYLKSTKSYTYYWDSAYVITTSCGDDFKCNVDIDQLPDLTLSGGMGVINGTVKEGVGYVGSGPYKGGVGTLGAGDPINGVGIGLGKKPNPGSNIVATTTTGTNGFYQFKNVPVGDYVIFANIPGMPMDSSYVVQITGSDSLPNKNYLADDSVVYIDNTTSIQFANNGLKRTESVLNVYPNPFNVNINVDFYLKEKSTVSLEVYDLLGEKISVLETASLNEGKYHYIFGNLQLKLSPGIYFVKLTSNENVYTQRIVELK